MEYVSLEPQLCADLWGSGMPECCFRSHSLEWLCESDVCTVLPSQGTPSTPLLPPTAKGRRP